ncbi:MAG: hypothetical protein V7K92_10090 [Nostoc sp.]|uniref:hypothetical protein n=1 Tax=Nostoc sp. TaxID=1180 RepID=UPI002FF3B615
MRLQFDNKINPFPETSRLTLTGDAPSVAIAKKSLVVLYRETNVRQFLLGSHCVAGVPSVVQRLRQEKHVAWRTPYSPTGIQRQALASPFGRRSDCLTTTLAHRTRKFES